MVGVRVGGGVQGGPVCEVNAAPVSLNISDVGDEEQPMLHMPSTACCSSLQQVNQGKWPGASACIAARADQHTDSDRHTEQAQMVVQLIRNEGVDCATLLRATSALLYHTHQLCEHLHRPCTFT
jgi:hypothetical protein